MIVVPLDWVSDLFGKLGGSLGGVPTIVFMIIPFIFGLIVGWFIKKALKIAIIAAIILIIATYFGFFGLTWSTLGDLGMAAIQGGILLFGFLPLGIGFVIGLILGFIFPLFIDDSRKGRMAALGYARLAQAT